MTYGLQTYGTEIYGAASGGLTLVAHPTLWRINAGNPANRVFDPIAPGDMHVFAFGMAAEITPGDYLVGVPIISISLAGGADVALAGFVAIGSAQISGSDILVEVTATPAGAACNYYFAAGCLTALGQVLSLGGRARVIAAALQ